MDNAEEVLQILERFTKLKQKEIPKELDEYLNYVAKTGDTVFTWSNIKYLFREKLVYVIKDFHDTTANIDDIPQYPNVDPFNYETMKSALLERLELFNAAPFTIQRVCELLVNPKKQYNRIDKFMRALEKNILVVSTIEPGRKQPESENGDSLDSVVISLDVNVDIEMENDKVFNPETHKPTISNSDNASSADIKLQTENNLNHDDSDLPEPKKLKLDLDESGNDISSGSEETAILDEDKAEQCEKSDIDTSKNIDNKESSEDDQNKNTVDRNKKAKTAEQNLACDVFENNASNSEIVDVLNAVDDSSSSPGSADNDVSTTKIEENKEKEVAADENIREENETSSTLNSDSKNSDTKAEIQSDKEIINKDASISSDLASETQLSNMPAKENILEEKEESTEKLEDVLSDSQKDFDSDKIQNAEDMFVEEVKSAKNEKTDIMQTNSISKPIEASVLPADSQSSGDQLMDEPAMPDDANDMVAVVSDSTSCVEMQNPESNEMATDELKMEDKPAEMDIDETNQIEAMDQ